jgi:hypothetical protein
MHINNIVVREVRGNISSCGSEAIECGLDAHIHMHIDNTVLTTVRPCLVLSQLHARLESIG